MADEKNSPAHVHEEDLRGDGQIKPVNAYSNAVDPRKLYPAHFDYLMRDLFNAGEIPERWRVIDACETRLDEHGMEVEFTLIRHGTDLVWHRRVMVAGGKLVDIRADG